MHNPDQTTPAKHIGPIRFLAEGAINSISPNTNTWDAGGNNIEIQVWGSIRADDDGSFLPERLKRGDFMRITVPDTNTPNATRTIHIWVRLIVGKIYEHNHAETQSQAQIVGISGEDKVKVNLRSGEVDIEKFTNARHAGVWRKRPGTTQYTESSTATLENVK
ncbi:hypothetical protein H0H93_009292 [Arthromyces matolae]|nr:hypothetical protein H0H93_009292 [Arthromyces matolae]